MQLTDHFSLEEMTASHTAVRHCIVIAVLMTLGACSSSVPLIQSTPPPPLEARLAEPCAQLAYPDALDYDAWLAWVIDVVLRNYGDCAAKHRETVRAWPN